MFSITRTLWDTPLTFNPNTFTYHSSHPEHADFGALPDPYTFHWSENLIAHPNLTVSSVSRALRKATKSAIRHPALTSIIRLLESIHRPLRPDTTYNSQTCPIVQIHTYPYGASKPASLYLMVIHHPDTPPSPRDVMGPCGLGWP